MSAIRTDQTPARPLWGSQTKSRNAAQQQTTDKSSSTLLWVVSLSSLTLNIVIIAGFLVARGLMGNMLADANQGLYGTINQLSELENPEVPIHMSQTVEVGQNRAININETVMVPINTSVKIDQMIPVQDQVVVPVNQTVYVERTASAPITFMGVTSYVPVPIALDIPINFEVVVPIDTQVPIQVDVPINMEVPFELNKDIELPPMTVDLDMESSIEVPLNETLSQTSLTTFLDDMYRLMNVLEQVLLIPLPEQR